MTSGKYYAINHVSLPDGRIKKVHGIAVCFFTEANRCWFDNGCKAGWQPLPRVVLLGKAEAGPLLSAVELAEANLADAKAWLHILENLPADATDLP